MRLNAKLIAAVAACAAIVSGCSDRSADTEGIDLTAQAQAAAKAAGCAVPSEGELHIYTWSDYISPDVIAGFEKGLGVKIVVDTFDSNEAMYAKLKAGGTGYDIMMPSSYQIELMAKDGMIDKLDHSKCPNVKANFDGSFKSQIIDSEFTYNAPYAVTYTGFIYKKDKIPQGADVAAWSILGCDALRGRITLLDDLREVIGAGLMSLGYKVNSTNPAEINAAVDQILKWRGSIRKFDSESYKTEVPSGATWLGHGYSTDITQVIVGDEDAGEPPRDDIGFALPKEGFVIAFDEMVVAKNAKRKDLAYAFINYIYNGDVAAANMDYICGPNPVKPGIDQLDPEYKKLIVLDPETASRGQVIRGFANNPEVLEIYNKAWDRIKATEAK
ncbi:MAG: spermidine/putrescine ABC transporter substrate-binding protein [Kiritimatiellae bacterium]|jgi:spermidine/putrescine transport system substrate-binding protein|nr:spermidine/putrescine ABC transporter substrate-binding protein [Kiritimatiellia bacterium]